MKDYINLCRYSVNIPIGKNGKTWKSNKKKNDYLELPAEQQDIMEDVKNEER